MDNYVGRFGDTLRRLTALDAQAGAFSPQQVGGADTAGAFSAAPPAPQGAMSGAGPSAPVVPAAGAGAFSGAGAQAPIPVAPADASGAPAFTPSTTIDESGATGQQASPTSWQDVAAAMPDEHKNALADHIESVVGNLKKAYRAVTRQNGVTPKPHASRADMAMYLSEVALQFAAARGSSGSDAEALAKGTIAANQHQEALRYLAQQKAEKDADELKKQNREDEVYARNRADTISDTKAKYAQEVLLENMKLKAEELRAKGQNSHIVINKDGEYTLIDDKGNAIPVTTDVDEVVKPAQGSRGMGTTPAKTRKVKRPVKALPKPNAAGLDNDTILKKVEDAAKAMRNDPKLRRTLKSQGMDDNAIEQEIQRRAREQVRGDVQSLGLDNPAGGGKVTDFNDLK